MTNAVLLMIMYIGNQTLHQAIVINVRDVEFCEKNKQKFIDAVTDEKSRIYIEKATCLQIGNASKVFE